MGAASIIAGAARLIAQHGESMVLTREGEGTTITLKGKRISGSIEPTGNSAEQQRFRVKISTVEILASAWSTKVPSASTDSITVGGRVRAVLDVRPLLEGATVGIYELEVAG